MYSLQTLHFLFDIVNFSTFELFNKPIWLEMHFTFFIMHKKEDELPFLNCTFSFCVTESSLDDLMDEIVTADNRGVSIGRNGSSVPSWSFGQSFFFSSTVVTTIGNNTNRM